MSFDALRIVHFLFTKIWSLFNSWYIPGTNVTPAGMAFFCWATILVIRIIEFAIFGSGGEK